MNRRRYLASVGVALSSGFVGCLEADVPVDSVGDGNESETGVESESETPTDFDPPSDVAIDVYNLDSEERTGRISVSRGEESVFETTFDVESDAIETIDPELHDTGQYELAVEVDGGTETTYPFSIDDYDLQAGSNLVVEITEDGVAVAIEE